MLRDSRDDYTGITRQVEKDKRKEYLATGTWDDHSEAEHLMSCSIGLSSSAEGESSLYFWLQKRTARNTSPPIQFSGQYGPEMTNLAKELNDEVGNLHNALETGVLLQMISKDKSLLNKLMYTSAPYGYKHTYSLGTRESERKLNTSTELIEAMTQKPSEFSTHQPQLGNPQTRVILTADKMLDSTNPTIRKNIEFNAYAGNQKALDEFHAKVDAHFAQAKDRVM